MVALSSLIPPVNLAAANGTLPVGNGGTGQTGYTDGQLLIGNSTNSALTKATLTAGANISVTNGAGSVTVAYVPTGLVQLATYTVSTAVATIDFTDISQNYDNLWIEFNGISHDSGTNQTINMRLSTNNGSSYSSTGPALSVSVAAGSPGYGALNIMNYARDYAVFSGGAQTGGASPAYVGNGNMIGQSNTAGGIDAIRIVSTAGNMDAGTITIYGWDFA